MLDILEKVAIRERREFVKELYKKIFEITKKPKKVLDLGCGLNPIYFPLKDITYIACDKEKITLKHVNRHFKKNKIRGEIINKDIRDAALYKIKKIDITIAFKVFDYLKKEEVKKILRKINTKWIVISFPTRTIMGKRMNNPKRKWLEKMVKIHKILRFHNEVFYIIKK